MTDARCCADCCQPHGLHTGRKSPDRPETGMSVGDPDNVGIDDFERRRPSLSAGRALRAPGHYAIR